MIRRSWQPWSLTRLNCCGTENRHPRLSTRRLSAPGRRPSRDGKSNPAALLLFGFRVKNDLSGGRAARNVPGDRCPGIGVKAAEEHDQSAAMIREPGKDPSSHGLIPRSLGFEIVMQASAFLMSGHRCPKLLESSAGLGVVRDDLFLFGGERLIAGKLASYRVRRIQTDDWNPISPTPGDDVLIGRRGPSPSAVKGGAVHKLPPTDFLSEIVVESSLLGDVDHFHAHGKGLFPPVKRTDNLLLQPMVRGLVVLLRDEDDPGAPEPVRKRSLRVGQGRVAMPGASREAQQTA